MVELKNNRVANTAVHTSLSDKVIAETLPVPAPIALLISVAPNIMLLGMLQVVISGVFPLTGFAV
jgi:hypothetical protein